MELSVAERLLLLGLLPKEGDITTVRIVHDLRRELSFTEEEHAALGVTIEDGRIHWDGAAEAPRDVPIGGKAQALIVSALEDLSDNGKLTEQHLGLYEKFVEGCPEEETPCRT